MAPSAGSFVASANEKLKVLYHNHSINEILDEIVTDIEKGKLGTLKHRISEVRHDVSGFERYLSATIEPKYYAQHRPKDSKAAIKVFAVPELLETILLNLDVMDLMPCYLVNRTFRDTMEQSPKLQIRLFLRPAPKDSSVCYPFQFENFKCESDHELSLGEKNEVKVTLRPNFGSAAALPSLGSRWKEMLVRQPPIHSMSYSINCYPEGLRTAHLNGRLSANNPHRPIRFIGSKSGLTVGDLYEAARKLFDYHSTCPQQTSKCITFRGPVVDP